MGSLDAGGSAEIVGATTPGCHDEPGRVISGLDPLTLSMRLDEGHDGLDIADDPMMVELIASLHVIQTAAAWTMGPSSTMFVAPMEDEAPKPPPSPVRSCGLASDPSADSPDLSEA